MTLSADLLLKQCGTVSILKVMVKNFLGYYQGIWMHDSRSCSGVSVLGEDPSPVLFRQPVWCKHTCRHAALFLLDLDTTVVLPVEQTTWSGRHFSKRIRESKRIWVFRVWTWSSKLDFTAFVEENLWVFRVWTRLSKSSWFYSICQRESECLVCEHDWVILKALKSKVSSELLLVTVKVSL